jgi:hypothetical protein
MKVNESKIAFIYFHKFAFLKGKLAFRLYCWTLGEAESGSIPVGEGRSERESGTRFDAPPDPTPIDAASGLPASSKARRFPGQGSLGGKRRVKSIGRI